MTITYTFFDTELGPFYVAETRQGLFHVHIGSNGLSSIKELADKYFPGQEIKPSVLDAIYQIMEYLSGKRREFDLKLDLKGTDFQLAVWSALAKIPYGRTMTYGEIATEVGRPEAARAVGQACRANPVPIVVPCHRVVAAQGDLGGYSGGLDKKKWLLTLEGTRLNNACP